MSDSTLREALEALVRIHCDNEPDAFSLNDLRDALSKAKAALAADDAARGTVREAAAQYCDWGTAPVSAFEAGARWQASRAAAPQAGLTSAPQEFDIYLDEEASALLRDTIGEGEASAVRIQFGNGHSGPGLYVSLAEHPEEGSIKLWDSPIAAAPQNAAPAEFCWLVELFEGDGTGNSAGWYHTGFVDIGGHSRTTKRPHEARRYTTKEQAECVAEKLGTTLTGTWKAVEHGFAAAPQSVGKVASGPVGSRDSSGRQWVDEPQSVEPVAASLADVPFLVYFDDYERRPEVVIGEAAARHRFAQISQQWNAHLFVKVASNTRDDTYAKNNAPFAAPTDAEWQEEAMRLATQMMRDSWATGDDAAWQPAHQALRAHIATRPLPAPPTKKEQP